MIGKSSFFLVPLILSVTIACGNKKEDLKVITSQEIKEGRLVLKNAAGELKQGSNELIVEFQDASGNLLAVENAQISAVMPMPGMAPMTTSMALKPAGEKGRFSTQPNFEMSGGWKFTAEYSGPSGAGSASFNLNIR